MRKCVFVFIVCLSWFNAAWSAVPSHPWGCEAEPLTGQSVSLRWDGREVTRWHYSGDYLRPFFFSLSGSSGQLLTRMGHPGAPNHVHHRSVWIAHDGVDGIDFWSDQTGARVRQKHCFVEQAQGLAAEYRGRSGFVVEKSDRAHHQFEVRRQVGQ